MHKTASLRLLLPALTSALLALPSLGHAAAGDDACNALIEARTSLVRMLGVNDPRHLTEMRAQVQVASANLEGLLSTMSATEPARVAAFKPTWEAFKKTREQEIIPAIMQGNHKEARTLVVGVQSQRMREMKAVLGCR
jgi:hypothetical protein